MNIYLDIETLPTSDPDVIAALEAGIKPPGNISKPESIQKWMDENKADALAAAISKTSFDGLHGRVCVICYAFDDGPVYSSEADDERKLLQDFYAHAYDVSTMERHGGLVDLPVTVVGHNVAGFDLPFLKHRSIINSVRPPNAIYKAMNAKPWESCIADTMLMWSSDREKRVSMDRLCKALGIPGKGDFDGSMVAATWPTDPAKVIEYCRQDVERTREIYKRLTFAADARLVKRIAA